MNEIKIIAVSVALRGSYIFPNSGTTMFGIGIEKNEVVESVPPKVSGG